MAEVLQRIMRGDFRGARGVGSRTPQPGLKTDPACALVNLFMVRKKLLRLATA